jgi:hypothetical protein
MLEATQPSALTSLATGGYKRVRVKYLAVVIFAGLLTAAAATESRAFAAEPLPGFQAQIPMPWDQPPSEFKEIERQGFHAGVEAAIHDYNHHREPDPESRREYRNPHVQRSFRADYRKGFRRGYNDAMRHMERSNGHQS